MNNKGLVSLNLKGCLMSLGFNYIGESLRQLKEFRISKCYNCNNENLKIITGNNKDIEVLKLYYLSKITSAGFEYIGRNLCKLKYLHVAKCKGMNDNNLKLITKSNKNLSHMNLLGCENITSEGYNYLRTNLHELKELNVGAFIGDYNINITDENNKIITKSNNSLESLNISRCSKLTRDGIKYIGENLNFLRDLNLEDCHNVVDNLIKLITAKNKKLMNLNVNGCIKLQSKVFIISGKSTLFKRMEMWQ